MLGNLHLLCDPEQDEWMDVSHLENRGRKYRRHLQRCCLMCGLWSRAAIMAVISVKNSLSAVIAVIKLPRAAASGRWHWLVQRTWPLYNEPLLLWCYPHENIRVIIFANMMIFSTACLC